MIAQINLIHLDTPCVNVPAVSQPSCLHDLGDDSAFSGTAKVLPNIRKTASNSMSLFLNLRCYNSGCYPFMYIYNAPVYRWQTIYKQIVSIPGKPLRSLCAQPILSKLLGAPDTFTQLSALKLHSITVRGGTGNKETTNSN